MPRKNETKLSQAKIDKLVRRHFSGEPVASLAKEYKVSRATAYVLIMQHKRKLLDEAQRAGVTSLDKKDKTTLQAELIALRQENAKLRNKVVALMIKAGEI
ncbi:MAG: helix-turn-helix domain-containing protein [Steroidobacteraceae bacterium]